MNIMENVTEETLFTTLWFKRITNENQCCDCSSFCDREVYKSTEQRKMKDVILRKSFQTLRQKISLQENSALLACKTVDCKTTHMHENKIKKAMVEKKR